MTAKTGFRRAAAMVAAGLVGIGGVVPANPARAAVPKPRPEQWWFTAWDVEDVWKISQGQGITVAVLDSGVNAKLPELRDVVLPGGDGRHGEDSDGRTDIDDEEGHGTEMAGLIASRGGPSGLVGVAPEVKILPVVIDGRMLSMTAGIRYAADHGAQVINVSSGYSYPGGCAGNVEQAVIYAVNKGAVVVASMGNEGNTTNFMLMPGSCGGVLAVGAVTNQKLAWVKTQRQDYVSVAAPGVQVGSVTKTGTFNNAIDGTSQASALAAAAVALVRSKYPQLTPREVVQRIINTTVDAGPTGPDNMTGSGVIVPMRALTNNVDKNAPNPTFDRMDQWIAEYPELARQEGATPEVTASEPSTKESAVAAKGGKRRGIPGVVIGGVGVLLFLAATAAVITVVLVSRGRRRARLAAAQQPFAGWPPDYPPGQR